MQHYMERAIDLILGNAVPIAVNAFLLGVGGVLEHYVPGIAWVFFVVTAIAILPVILAIVIVLVANALDIPEHDGDYPVA
jgi:hypothetical protein